MKNMLSKQTLSHQKVVKKGLQCQNNPNISRAERKLTFSEIISELKNFLKSVLFNELYLQNAFKLIESLKEKYEKDIFAIYEANLKIQTMETKKNQNSSKFPLAPLDKNKLETAQFLPLESMLDTKEFDYKITLNGLSIKDDVSKKMTIKTKKTLDTQKSSDCQEEKELLRWKSMDQKNFPKYSIKATGSQKNFEIAQNEKNTEVSKQPNRLMKGLDYLIRESQRI